MSLVTKRVKLPFLSRPRGGIHHPLDGRERLVPSSTTENFENSTAGSLSFVAKLQSPTSWMIRADPFHVRCQYLPPLSNSSESVTSLKESTYFPGTSSSVTAGPFPQAQSHAAHAPNNTLCFITPRCTLPPSTNTSVPDFRRRSDHRFQVVRFFVANSGRGRIRGTVGS